MSAIAKAGTEGKEGPKLEAPKSTPFTTEELKKFNGAIEGEPIYVAIKGTIFDGKFINQFKLKCRKSSASANKRINIFLLFIEFKL